MLETLPAQDLCNDCDAASPGRDTSPGHSYDFERRPVFQSCHGTGSWQILRCLVVWETKGSKTHDFGLALVANAQAKLRFWKVPQACACDEHASHPVSRVFQACVCGEHASFPVSEACTCVKYTRLPSRACCKHALVVSTQACSKFQQCLEHALARNCTSMFWSGKCFSHALVSNARASSNFEECFKPALVARCSSLLPFERCFSG